MMIGTTRVLWMADETLRLLRNYTLPETNIAPENGWLEDEFPVAMAYFHGMW